MLRFLRRFSNRLKELANITTSQALVKDIKYAVCAKRDNSIRHHRQACWP